MADYVQADVGQEQFKRFIIVTVSWEAFHRYVGAPDEVAFLGNWHRHLFHIKVCWPVNHNNRDLEFFIQQRKLGRHLDEEHNSERAGSCEMIAEKILTKFPNASWVECWEDKENGARLERA